jgi:hypothetical protein
VPLLVDIDIVQPELYDTLEVYIVPDAEFVALTLTLTDDDTIAPLATMVGADGLPPVQGLPLAVVCALAIVDAGTVPEDALIFAVVVDGCPMMGLVDIKSLEREDPSGIMSR